MFDTEAPAVEQVARARHVGGAAVPWWQDVSIWMPAITHGGCKSGYEGLESGVKGPKLDYKSDISWARSTQLISDL